MFIKLLKAIGDHKAGAILDEADATAKAYIDAGLAEDASASATKTLLDAGVAQLNEAAKGLTDALTGQLNKATEAVKANTPHIAGRIDPVAAEADRTKSFGDFVGQVYKAHSNDHDVAKAANERIAKVYLATKALNEGTGTAGGFLVPPEYLNSLFSFSAENEVMRPGCTQIPMGSPELNWPSLDQYGTPSKGRPAVFGGVQVYRKSEAAQRTASQPAFNFITFKATDLTGYTEASRDLFADSSISLDAYLKQLFSGALAWRMDYDFIQGSGVGEPLGFFNAPATQSVTRTTTNNIKYEDIVNMLAKLRAPSWGKAVWIANVTTFPQIAALRDAAGNSLFVSSANAGATGTPSGTLMGMPILYTEKVPVLGTLGDINLVDRSAYGVGTMAGLEIGMSEHFKFDTDQVAFRFKIRNDGRPLMKAPYKQADGSGTTVSPFVQVAA